ncbi:MAG TPA: peptidylprolyl isomerase [Gammaproteobacteria bacterium]|nr:peptidylprolyl isomerase [Gammaproteobacteria bacterium]
MNISFLRLIQSMALSASLFSLSASADEKSPAVAIVNGSAISAETLGMYGEKRIGVKPGKGFPERKRQELITELINRELIYQDAIKEGLDKDKFVQLEIEEQIHNLLTRSRIGKLLRDNPPSEKMLKEIYQTQIVAPASVEYRARHILVPTMEAAKSVIEELNKGAKFEALAKQKSTGPSSTQGGDLGWFSPNQMAKHFSDAVKKLKPGEYSKRPVKTRFGWHVIKLEQARKVDPPAFESVQEQIMKVAQNNIINQYIEELKQSANIEIQNP